jgi:carbonic anhydrase
MIVAMAVFWLSALIIQCVNAAEWTYDDHHGVGPTKWRESYPTCAGARQSPIDIAPFSAEFAEGIGKFQLFGYDQVLADYRYSLTNNGHTVQLNIISGNITLRGAALNSRYRLAQLHVHWGATNDVGSEHTVSKKAYPLEIHFVHFDSDRFKTIGDAVTAPGGLAVVGVFGQVDRISFPNEALQHIIDEFVDVRYRGNTTNVEAFALQGLLPDNINDFYRYIGSLTTPPCYESVIWTVLKQPLKISAIQLNSFRTLSHNARAERDEQLANNYRPVQPLGSRTIYRSFDLPPLPTQPPRRPLTCAGVSSRRSTSALFVVAAVVTVAKTIFGKLWHDIDQ